MGPTIFGGAVARVVWPVPTLRYRREHKNARRGGVVGPSTGRHTGQKALRAVQERWGCNHE
jgi:hypothetical protein